MLFRKGTVKMIYLDYAAATPVRKEAVKAMKDAEKHFANPSSMHEAGKKAKEILGREYHIKQVE